MTVTPADLPLLKEGIEAGLQQLGQYQLERQNEFQEQNRFGFEMVYTFPFERITRKRRSLLYYREQWQYSLICQGATEKEYDYWLPMFEFMMLTFKSSSFDLSAWISEAAKKYQHSPN